MLLHRMPVAAATHLDSLGAGSFDGVATQFSKAQGTNFSTTGVVAGRLYCRPDLRRQLLQSPRRADSPTPHTVWQDNLRGDIGVSDIHVRHIEQFVRRITVVYEYRGGARHHIVGLDSPTAGVAVSRLDHATDLRRRATLDVGAMEILLVDSNGDSNLSARRR